MQMAKPTDHPGFKTLQAEWYGKLAQDGFGDIECATSLDRPLKKSGTVRRFERMDAVTREARIQYFRRVQHHVSQAEFPNQREHDIMNLYAQGVSQVMIQEVLALKRCQVFYPLYRWLRAWGLK